VTSDVLKTSLRIMRSEAVISILHIVNHQDVKVKDTTHSLGFELLRNTSKIAANSRLNRSKKKNKTQHRLLSAPGSGMSPSPLIPTVNSVSYGLGHSAP
jgi:hypothetical protein